MPFFHVTGSTTPLQAPALPFADTVKMSRFDANNDMQLSRAQARMDEVPIATHATMLHAHHWDIAYAAFPPHMRVVSPNLDHPFPRKAALAACWLQLAELGLIDQRRLGVAPDATRPTLCGPAGAPCIAGTGAGAQRHRSCRAGAVVPYIAFDGEPAVPPRLRTVAELLTGLVPAMRGTISTTGGVSVTELVSVASDPLSGMGLRVSSAGISMSTAGDRSGVAFHAVDRAPGIAVDFHGGRAHTNNAALLSVLHMAAATEIRCGVLVLPQTYQGSAAAAPATQNLRRMANWHGVSLRLRGVVVVQF